MATEDIKRAGLKTTQARITILQLFEDTHAHLSADQVYRTLKERGNAVPLATVYRVLGQFEAAHILMRHRFDDDFAVYELNDGEHHDHLVCTACHTVVEFVDPVIEAHQDEIAAENGFAISSHALYLYGLCKACQ
jgi:Fur family ferric uptake transcriptional regulator